MDNKVYVYFRKGIHKDDFLPIPVFDSFYAMGILAESARRAMFEKGYKYYGLCHVEIDLRDGRCIGARDKGVRIEPTKDIIVNESHWVRIEWDVTDPRFPKQYKNIKEFVKYCQKDHDELRPYPYDDIAFQQAGALNYYDNPGWYCSEYLMYKIGLSDLEDNLNVDKAYGKMLYYLNMENLTNG